MPSNSLLRFYFCRNTTSWPRKSPPSNISPQAWVGTGCGTRGTANTAKDAVEAQPFLPANH